MRVLGYTVYTFHVCIYEHTHTRTYIYIYILWKSIDVPVDKTVKIIFVAGVLVNGVL